MTQSLLPDTPQPMDIQYVDRPLSIDQLFRLVEIAHENDTLNCPIRAAALKVLDRALHPLMIAKVSQ